MGISRRPRGCSRRWWWCTHPVVEVGGGAAVVVVDAGGVQLEGLLAGVDGHGDGPHGGHGLPQRLLVALGDVHEAHVVGAGVLGVVSEVTTWLEN